MKNIVITGGLGYIGTELCKLYSGECRFNNITVIDKRFVSERVKQLRDWGINFIQSSIRNE
jgi:UDP-glucose 4-epimerase